jgi:hypothetical protein
VFRFAKFKSESLELRSKAFLSFFVIISKVEFLAAMVNRKNLTDEQCVRLKDCLLEHLTNDELPRGILRVAAVKFSVTQTVSRLWKGWRASHAMALNGEWDVTSKKKACGWGLKSIVMMTLRKLFVKSLCDKGALFGSCRGLSRSCKAPSIASSERRKFCDPIPVLSNLC